VARRARADADRPVLRAAFEPADARVAGLRRAGAFDVRRRAAPAARVRVPARPDARLERRVPLRAPRGEAISSAFARDEAPPAFRARVRVPPLTLRSFFRGMSPSVTAVVPAKLASNLSGSLRDA
jgi:hypothetical protein